MLFDAWYLVLSIEGLTFGAGWIHMNRHLQSTAGPNGIVHYYFFLCLLSYYHYDYYYYYYYCYDYVFFFCLWLSSLLSLSLSSLVLLIIITIIIINYHHYHEQQYYYYHYYYYFLRHILEFLPGSMAGKMSQQECWSKNWLKVATCDGHKWCWRWKKNISYIYISDYKWINLSW